jgi:hypothetical protein
VETLKTTTSLRMMESPLGASVLGSEALSPIMGVWLVAVGNDELGCMYNVGGWEYVGEERVA